MNINEVLTKKSGEQVSFKAVLTKKDLTPKNGGGNLLNIALADSNSRFSFPIFDDVDKFDKGLVLGRAYLVNGVVNIWNGNFQLKGLTFRSLKEDEYTPGEFISAYDIPEPLITQFENIINGLIEPYKTIAKHTIGMEGDIKRWTKFIACPSAESHHGNKIGGLFLHTMGVIGNIANMEKMYGKLNMYGDAQAVINWSRLKLKAIIHDYKKVDEYEYDTFIRRIPGVVGHIYDGVGYIDEINKECGNILSREELENIKVSILSHHGQYGPQQPNNDEDMLLHLSDMIDSRIVGRMEEHQRNI